MNPIPLTGPDGGVYAYACGTCHHVSPGGDALLRHDGPDDVAAQHSREMAESCCVCQRCGAVITEYGDLECATCKPALDLHDVRKWLDAHDAVLTVSYLGGVYFAEILGRGDPKLVPQGIAYLRGVKSDPDLVAAIIGAMNERK